MTLFNNLNDESFLRTRVANRRAAAYYIAGHEMRHLNIIKNGIYDFVGDKWLLNGSVVIDHISSLKTKRQSDDDF